MELTHLSDNELLNYLTLFHTHDPIVNRLVKMLSSSVMQDQVDELVKIGMNLQTWELDYEGIDYPLNEYIYKLEREIGYRDEEMVEYESKLIELKLERDSLKTRGVAELISELYGEISFADQRISKVNQELNVARRNEELAMSKLKMWTYLKTDTAV